jgi:tRNA nucleotidyltransferase (CCA-adding enzyme)
MEMIKIPDNVNIILNTLFNNGHQGFIVGGCVRDSLLSHTPKDWDICTNATPQQILEVFSSFRTIPTGLKHGTITVVVDDNFFEITTYRIDGDYSDNRRPDNVTFTANLDDDLSRRDFTINAMAYNNYVGLVDLFNGQNDLKCGFIRCVGNANDRFNEDALRMMRAIRFSAQLGFGIVLDTMEAIWRNAKLINNISKERIQQELNKIILSKNPNYIKDLDYSRLLNYIIPELSNCFGFPQNNPHHFYNVGTHIVLSMRQIENNLQLRLTMMLHDIGKPVTKIIDENGIGHFPEHSVISSQMAEKILRNLKYDNFTIEKVSKLILHHMDDIRPNKRVIRRLLNNLGEDDLRNLFKIKNADALAQNLDEYQETKEILDQSEKVLNQIIAEKECFSMKDLAINGDDLKKIGFKEGRELGDILKNLLNLVIENPFLNSKEQLLNLVRLEDLK